MQGGARLDGQVESYLSAQVPEPDPVRAAMEALGAERSFPIIGPIVGNLCSVAARAAGARRVFEMGSGFGYSTLWFARAVGPGGLVVHTEGSAANSSLAREFLGKAGLLDRVRFEVGDAREIFRAELARPGSPGSWDVVFNDMDKEQYPDALPLARAALRPGGLFICDNMLWFGRVFQPEESRDPSDQETRGIASLTRSLREAADFQTTIVPIRDGVTISVRLSA